MLTTTPKFLRVLYDILHVESSAILSWSSCGTYFQVFDVARLEQDVLPRYFKHSKFASFQRQLNNFGFRKWTKTRASVCTFSHDALVRCAPGELLTLVNQTGVVSPHTKIGSGKRSRTSSENSETTDSGSDCDSMCCEAKKLKTAEDEAEDESLRMLLDGMFVDSDEFEFFDSLETPIKGDDDELDWLLPEAEEQEEFVELVEVVELWDGLFDAELPLETDEWTQWSLCSM